MANTFITSSMITAETLRIIHNKSALLGRVNRKYQGEFGRNGGKVGDTINIRKPIQFTVRDGPVAVIQDVTQTSIPMTIQPEIGVDFAFSDFDLALKIDDFSRQFLRPAALRLATAIDMRITAALYKAAYNSVGTPGTPPASQAAAQKLVLDAGVMLTLNGAEGSDRTMLTNPAAESNFLQYLNLGFNSQRKIGNQYERGTMEGTVPALGFDWASSPNMPLHTVGALGGTPLVNGASQGLINAGATDNPSTTTTVLITDGWTAAVANRVKKGDTFTIAGVFQVNPDSKQTNGTLQQFTANADAASDAAGNMTLTITPAIIAGGAFQNVTARPADNAAITFLGTASTSYPVSLGFVEDAFTFATVDLEMPKGMDMADQKEADGLSIRFVRGFDILNNRRICRFDILAGWAATMPEWAVRVYAG